MSAVSRHRVAHYAEVDGIRDRMSLSLTDARARVASARRNADVFHSFQFAGLDGTPMHVVYALYQAGSPRHGFSALGVKHDVTYLYVMTAAAVEAAFGLAPRPTP